MQKAMAELIKTMTNQSGNIEKGKKMDTDIGVDHCRVKPNMRNAFERFEFFRHFFAYDLVFNRLDASCWVLEIGSGEGYGSGYLSAKTAMTVAIDLSFDALRHTMENYKGIRPCKALGENLPFASNSFDAVIAFQVIEHSVASMKFLKEIHRVLKMDGKLFLTTPNRKLRLWPLQKPWNAYHVHEYSGRELNRIIKNVFSKCTIHGTMAPSEWMEFEKKRAKNSPMKVLRGKCMRIIKKSLMQFGFNHCSPHQNKIYNEPASIEQKDFHLSPDIDGCLDFFVEAQKSK